MVADGNSIAAASPAQYHGLNTFTPRALQQMRMPDIPVSQGVLEAASGMLPPETPKNPYCHISWVWMLVGYGLNPTSTKRAAEYVAKKTCAVLTQALLEVNIQVPAVDSKSAWTATSTIQGDRVRVVRTGSRLAGGTFEIPELFNIKLRISTDVSPSVRKELVAFAAKHKNIMTVVDVLAGQAFPTQGAIATAEGPAKPCPAAGGATKAKNTRGMTKPRKTLVKAKVAKKPARK